MKQMKIIALLSVIVFFTACSTVPFTGRSQLSLVDDATLQQEATLSYQQFLKDPKTKVVTSGADAAMVQRVGSRISTAINQYFQENGYGNQYKYDWEFRLIQDPSINAWCMPGGKVAVFTGLLAVTKNEAALATVIGHEIGHAIAHHSAERISQMLLAQAGGVAVGAATAGKSDATQAIMNQIYGVGGQLALLKYSRNQESEADRLGLIFMAMAGYDPNEAIPFWQRMSQAKEGGGAPPEFLSTHPSDATRIRNIEKLIPEAMKYYKAR
jgi:predicted Zn-dependent protease